MTDDDGSADLVVGLHNDAHVDEDIEERCGDGHEEGSYHQEDYIVGDSHGVDADAQDEQVDKEAFVHVGKVGEDGDFGDGSEQEPDGPCHNHWQECLFRSARLLRQIGHVRTDHIIADSIEKVGHVVQVEVVQVLRHLILFILIRHIINLSFAIAAV